MLCLTSYRDGTMTTGFEGEISAFPRRLSKSTGSQVRIMNVAGIPESRGPVPLASAFLRASLRAGCCTLHREYTIGLERGSATRE